MQLPSFGLVEKEGIEVILRKCREIKNQITFSDAISNGQQLSFIKSQNKEGLEEILVILITKLVNSQHTTQKMTDDQIIDCAEDIIKDFWYFKFEEVVLVLESIRRAKSFNRLDESVIYEGFTTYEKNNRNNAIEMAKIKEQQIRHEQINFEIQLIKEKYESVKSGESKMLIDQISDAKKQREEDERQANNAYILEKAEYLKKMQLKK